MEEVEAKVKAEVVEGDRWRWERLLTLGGGHEHKPPMRRRRRSY